MPRYAVAWGHLAFVLGIAVAVAWYLVDTLHVSVAANNLLFVGPVAVAALLLCATVLRQCVRPIEPAATARAHAAPATPSSSAGGAVRIAGVAAALVLLVALLGAVGFDVAILVFCAATMWICGERRPAFLVGFPVAVTLVVVLGFRAILPFPMPTLVL